MIDHAGWEGEREEEKVLFWLVHIKPRTPSPAGFWWGPVRGRAGADRQMQTDLDRPLTGTLVNLDQGCTSPQPRPAQLALSRSIFLGVFPPSEHGEIGSDL